MSIQSPRVTPANYPHPSGFAPKAAATTCRWPGSNRATSLSSWTNRLNEVLSWLAAFRRREHDEHHVVVPKVERLLEFSVAGNLYGPGFRRLSAVLALDFGHLLFRQLCRGTQIAVGVVSIVDSIADLVSCDGVIPGCQTRQIQGDRILGMRGKVLFIENLIVDAFAWMRVGEIPDQRLHAAGFIG